MPYIQNTVMYVIYFDVRCYWKLFYKNNYRRLIIMNYYERFNLLRNIINQIRNLRFLLQLKTSLAGKNYILCVYLSILSKHLSESFI